jgi:hypothetical protein
MSFNTQHLSFSITAALGPNRIAAYTANRGEVAPATAATQKLAGAVDLGADAAGQMVDVEIGGIGKVRLGGVVAAGDPITSDANSKGVAASFAAGQTRYVIGFAIEPGVADDIIRYRVAPSVIAG